MTLHGSNILGDSVSKAGSKTFQAFDPTSGLALDPLFYESTDAEAHRAMEMAEEAFPAYRAQSPDAIARFLEAIATGLERMGDKLIARAHSETALPLPRLVSERGRTTGQLRMFASLVREGSWVDARIDRADPNRTPAPKPDLRRMLVPLGPIVVFGASNFPLAYSVCGGDTASALAGGNPVVVKAHPAHPGTSELAARAVQEAAKQCGMPSGVFSMVHGQSPAVSLALVRHPAARAVGFTGSLQAGRALFDAAASRPVPIPVFAEMGSLNPVFVLPDAMRKRGAEIAQRLGKSVTLGVGQFCTKPGLVFGLRDANLDSFLSSLSNTVDSTPTATMLHAGIAERYRTGVDRRLRDPKLQLGTKTTQLDGKQPAAQACPAVFTTEASWFLDNEDLHQEVFGPATLLVACQSPEEFLEIARSLEGQLTVTIHATEDDLREHASLLDLLREKAGRLVFGGVPTGVEVSPAMHHGGPYPATTDPRFTSVGTAAILRFVRPVCYQDCPPQLLPPELQDENPRRIWRLIDGRLTQAALTASASIGA